MPNFQEETLKATSNDLFTFIPTPNSMRQEHFMFSPLARNRKDYAIIMKVYGEIMTYLHKERHYGKLHPHKYSERLTKAIC